MINNFDKKAAGVYVHLPYCKHKCAYCAFVSSPDYSTSEEYLYRLKVEIADRGQPVHPSTLYFGGGTPSTLTGGYLSEIYRALGRKFCFDGLCEFTVECNPDSVTEAFLTECKGMGVTRLSLGLQSANDAVLKRIGRIHDVQKFVSAVRLIRELTDCDVSSDLIIGLPGEEDGDIERAIDLLSSLGVEHVSLYSLTVEEGTPLWKSGYRPDEDAQADGYERAAEYLSKKGYARYEVSNFAKNGKISKHNYKYWTGADYYGFGVAAHSLIGGVRYANTEDVAEYIKGNTLKEKTVLSESDEREELIMLRLRLCEGLDLSEYERLTKSSLLKEKEKEIKRLTALGLVETDGKTLKTTDKGVYLLNSIITELI